MNNNRGNFGSMGLNDYQSGISGNMYNNLPNNFSNIPNANNNGASPYNYNNFDDNTINNTNNTMNSYFNEMQSSSSVNPNTTSSLGSMFDGYNNAPVNVPESTNQDSNLFVSHIREDNLPKTENQFLPNFDNFNQTDNFNNGFNNLDNQAEFNNMPNNAFNDLSANNNEPTMDTGFNDINNQNDNGNYNPAFDNQNMDTNYADYNNFNNMGNMLPRDSMNNQNQNYFMNDLNSGMNPRPMGVNNNVGMNGFGNNDSNYNNNFGAPIPDNGGMTTMYQPNQGSMFSQPLNLVDVPNNNSFENTIPTESNTPSLNSFENNLEQMSNPDFSSSNNGDSSMEEMPVNNEENYNDMMFSQPVSMGGDIEETNDEFGNDNSAFVSGSASQEIPEINPSYDTPTTEENNNFKEREELNSQSNNQDYINLDPVYTLKTPLDAVLELKKTTDAIKQNNIDIETEEIDFDDVYQIIIKIKKTDDII